MNKKNKKQKKLFVFAIVAIVVILLLFFTKKQKQKKDENENNNGGSGSSVGNCNPEAILKNGNVENNVNSALYWNNSHGLVKTATIWKSFNEIDDKNNKTRYKAFRDYESGVAANLYNLLYYIYTLNIKRVGDVVEKWVGTKKGSEIYKNYIKVTGFDENCILDSKEKIKVFFTNQAIAENNKNDTNFIYTNFNSLYNYIKSLNFITNLPN